MLGGYYLGQEYLGISGWISAGTLSVQDAVHSQLADNIIIVQQHSLIVNNALHNHFVDNLALSEGKLLLIDNTNHGLTSDVPILIRNIFLEIQDARSTLYSTDVLKTINWDELGFYQGVYKKDFKYYGDLTPEELELLIYKKQQIKDGVLSIVELTTSGVLIPINKPSGIL